MARVVTCRRIAPGGDLLIEVETSVEVGRRVWQVVVVALWLMVEVWRGWSFHVGRVGIGGGVNRAGSGR